MGEYDMPQQATAVACAKDAAVHVSFASSRLKLRLSPTAFAMTPDEAMALSIELQKAAIDARQQFCRGRPFKSVFGMNMSTLLSIFGLGALLGTGNYAARAADLGRPSVVMPTAPAFNWTGLYLGGSVGGRWSHVTWTTSGPFIFDPSTTPASFDNSSVRLGGYLGYNWQFSPSWVAGVEGDLAWADSSQTRGGIPGTFGTQGIQTAPPAAAAVDSSTVKEGGDGGVRGRLGFLITPTWLVYATGGLAWQDDKFTARCDGSANSWCIAPRGETVSTTRSGWAVGGGLEGQLIGNWLGRAEYRFADFGTASHTFFAGTIDQVTMSHTLKTHTFFIGLAYKF